MFHFSILHKERLRGWHFRLLFLRLPFMVSSVLPVAFCHCQAVEASTYYRILSSYQKLLWENYLHDEHSLPFIASYIMIYVIIVMFYRRTVAASCGHNSQTGGHRWSTGRRWIDEYVAYCKRVDGRTNGCHVNTIQLSELKQRCDAVPYRTGAAVYCTRRRRV